MSRRRPAPRLVTITRLEMTDPGELRAAPAVEGVAIERATDFRVN